MLALLRQIPRAHHSVVEDLQWQRDRFKSRQIAGMTLGLVGLGRIGSHMANYANAFGMQVMACDPFITTDRFSRFPVRRVKLEQLCREADIISLHASETSENYHLIGAEQIAQMKPSALILSTARGSLLDEKAAALALQNHQLGGVACDVLEREMDDNFLANSVLLQAAREGHNVILTPHIGGCTLDAMQHTEEVMADHIYQLLATQDG